MNDLDAHQRRGAHRARGNPWRAVLPSLLAVASVVSLIVALTVWRGQDGGSPASFADGTSTSATSDAVSAAPRTPSPSGSASATTSASASTTGGPVPAIGVVVLNDSGRTGLGARVAQTLRAAGWTVAAVGNFHGAVPSTTIYYPAGHAADAAALGAALPGPDRLRPRFGNLSKTRLTVVLTASYPG